MKQEKGSTTPLAHSHATNLSFLLILGLILLVPAAMYAPLIDRDEPRFSQATVEMMDRHDWIIPTFNQQFRFDKPILTYWMMRFSYMALGINEFAARLHTIVSTLLTALVLYWIGFRWFGNKRVGLLAGLSYLTTLQVLLHGRLAVADAPMILGVVLVHIALYELIIKKRTSEVYPWKWFGLLYGGMAFGFLAKGPIIVFVPILTLLLYRFVFRRKPIEKTWLTLKPILGLSIATLIVAAWGIPALIITKGGFWAEGINEHIVKRGTEAFNGRTFLFVFYLITFWISFFPWSTKFIPMIANLRYHYDVRHAFLLAWFISPLLIFTFYATQLPHYILPGFPALCLLFGAYIESGKTLSARVKSISSFSTWLLVGLISLIPITFLSFCLFLPFPEKWIPLQKCLLGFSVGLLGIIALTFQANMRTYWLILGACTLSSLGFAFGVASIKPTVPALQLKEHMRSMPENTRFFGYRYFEPSLIFYSNRLWNEPQSLDAITALAFSQRGPTFFVLREREWNLGDFWKHLTGQDIFPKPAELQHHQSLGEAIDQLTSNGYQQKTIEGLNLGRTSWVKLHILWRE
ncbi:MAG: glycosyltransferase family 39 protein [Verrucomicrobiota bacterium]